MNDQNFSNIQALFEEKTGIKLQRKRPVQSRRLAVLVAVASALCLLAAFTYPIFSPLAGDALTLHADYLGNGIVCITAQNHSDKTLNFQPQVRLMEWVTGKEVNQISGKVRFSETEIPANSQVSFTLDLSDCYDIALLEATHPKQYHYLVLTNRSFLHGQQWKCTVHFNPSQTADRPADDGIVSIEPGILANIEPELRYYFETEQYAGAFSFNPHHFEYLQKVEELLQRSGKRFVAPIDASLMVEPILDGVMIDDTWPKEQQYQLGSAQQITLSDAFGRLVGGTDSEHIKYLACRLPCCRNGVEYICYLPLLYFSTFPVSEIQSQSDCAFIHGQIVSFEELSDYLVYQDAQYVCYNVTHLFYTDLRTYMRSYAAAKPHGDHMEYPVNEALYQRAENVLAYYAENLKIMTMEDFVEASPHVQIQNDTGADSCFVGLGGMITSNRDIMEIYITVTDENDAVLYRETILPDNARYYDLTQAEAASQFLKSLSGGTYTLEIAALVDARFYGYRPLLSVVLEP